MMTVFFYSGITSYPGVSTEEKTIIVKFITINEKVLIKPNFAGINFKDISSHF